MPKEPIQKIINKRRCSKCPEFQKEGNVGFCVKYGWEISLDLAERQTLCFFGDGEIFVIPKSPISPQRKSYRLKS